MTEIVMQKRVKIPNSRELHFLSDLDRWGGTATTGELAPQTSQADNSARQACKRRSWATFDRYYWRLTWEGRRAMKDALALAHSPAYRAGE